LLGERKKGIKIFLQILILPKKKGGQGSNLQKFLANTSNQEAWKNEQQVKLFPKFSSLFAKEDHVNIFLYNTLGFAKRRAK